jgi:tungstate transport system substrate-binding protein
VRVRLIHFILLALFAAVCPAVAGCRAEERPQQLVLATTTSVANSGLLEPLLNTYRTQHGVVVRSHLVGSGLALRMLETGDVDVVISHAPEAEASYLQRHPPWQYRKLMFNDFVIVGPKANPAGVSGADTVESAMRRIADSPSRFISRGDGSGTHEREQQLWAAAGARPEGDRLVAAGSGMGTTLQIASTAGAYTLTDRATLAQQSDTLQLVILFEGGPLLLNTYAVVVDPAGRASGAARGFLEWLTVGSGRDVIQSYRIRGIPGFTVWPETAAHDAPAALPR